MQERNALLNMDEKDTSAVSMEDEPEKQDEQEADPGMERAEDANVIPIEEARQNHGAEYISTHDQKQSMSAAGREERPSLKEKLDTMREKASMAISGGAFDRVKLREEAL